MNRMLMMAATTVTAYWLAGCDAMMDQAAQNLAVERAKEQVAGALGDGKPRFRNVFQSPSNFTCGEVARYQSTEFQRFFASGIDEPFLEEDLGKDKIDMMWEAACVAAPEATATK
ncbi:hypothetical protein SAMN05428974_3187 [Sphingopyxis sp. YR583]|jgi:hypothetical protein|uniref:hypothetical protein n=1 Tax=Sphingopyxis sp. YR583 TaxID=1881047 RepID=UPI0008A7D2BD|nr:hypothetical protein [Sphingopyxis sp. YR583]SEH19076.1 hypothetical protein SAMN05428974_3187 [Sphingopyxis sp. YR583]